LLLVPQSYPGTLEFLHHLGSAQMLLNALFKSQFKVFPQQRPINIAHQGLNEGFICLIHDVSLLSYLSHHFSTATSISSRARRAVVSNEGGSLVTPSLLDCGRCRLS
jgi:hypothetical protein